MTEIGKVTIKVTPDTKGFGAKAKTEIEGQLDDGVPVDVKPKVAKASAAKANAEIDEVARDRTAKIRVDYDEAKLQDSLRRMASSVDRFDRSWANKTEVFTGKQMSVNLDKIIQKLDNAKNPFGLSPDVAATQRMMDAIAKSNFDNDVKNARASAKAQIEEFANQSQRATNFLNEKMKLDTAQASLDAAAWRARESVKNLHVKMELDTKGATAKVGLMKLLTGAGEVGGGIFAGFNGIAEGAAKAASGFRLFGVGAAAMLAVASLIPPALALIAGGLLILPGALAGLMVPLATVAIGFGGIQKALQNAGFLADKLDKKGNPNGKKTAGEMIKELQTAVSDTFEQKLTPVFQNATKLIEPLKASLPSVAAGVSDLAKGFFDAVTSQVGMERIQSTIQNIGTALTNAAPGLGAFTDGFINLAEKVSQRFPGVGDAFTKLGNQFNNWITKFTSPDSNGISDLDRSLTSLHDTWNEIAGLFSSDLIGKGFDFLKDPDFGKSMVEFVQSIRSLVQDSLPALADSFSQISTILKPITDAISPVIKLLENPLVKKGLEQLNPTKPITDAFKPTTTANQDAQAQLDAATKAAKENALQTGGEYATQFQAQVQKRLDLAKILGIDPALVPPLVQPAGTAAGNAFNDAYTAAITGGQAPGQGVNAIFGGPAAAATAGGDAAQAYSENFLNGITGGGPAGGGVPAAINEANKFQASEIINAFGGGGALGASADIGVQLSEKIKAATDTATTTLRTGLAGLSTEFQAKLAEVGTGSKTLIDAALLPLQTAPQTVATAFSAIAGVIAGSFAPAVAAIASGATRAVQVMSAQLAQIPAVAMSASNSLQSIAAAGMNGMVQAVATGGAQVVQAVAAVAGQIAALGGTFYAAGQGVGMQIGAGMAAGIRASIPQAIAAAGALANAVTQAAQVNLDSHSPSRVFKGIGEDVGDGFVIGMDSKGDSMVKSVRDILEQVKAVFGDASGLTLNFNLGGGSSTAGPVGQLNNQINEASTNAKALGTNLGDAMTPVDPLTPDGKKRLDEITKQLKESEILKDQLRIQKDSAGTKEDKKAVQAQIDQINAQDNILKLEQDKLQYAKKYGAEQWNIADALNSVGQQTMDAGFGFAKSNIDQLQSDLGIGGGAITGGANALWDWGTKAVSNFVFNTSNVDDTMSIYQNQANKEARGIS